LFHRFFHAGLIAMEDRRVDAAGADAVDANLVLRELERCRARQVDDAGFRRAVGVQPVEAADTRDRRRGDNRAAANFAHLGRRMLHPEEYAAQQYILALVPILDGDLFERSDCPADSGVVVNDVEAPELLDRACDERLDFSFGGDVGFLKDRATGVLFAIANRGFATLDVKVRDHDRRTLRPRT